MHTIRLSIGGLKFCLILPHPADIGREFRPFLLSETGGACETKTSEEDVVPAKRQDKSVAVNRDDIIVEYRQIDNIPDVEVTVSPDAAGVTVSYPPEQGRHFSALRGCLIYLPMERLLLAHDRFILHASFVTSPWGGLLFSGKAGAGKSTQAELWREHMGSTVINGDRAIVAKEEGGFRAYGSPYAGSSGYYILRDEPIHAVILPEQAAENRIERVPDAEACRKLLLQITVDHGRTGDVSHLCDLVEELIRTVPVLRLYCTPDARAVDALRGALERIEQIEIVDNKDKRTKADQQRQQSSSVRHELTGYR